jgi:hypothetical protein
MTNKTMMLRMKARLIEDMNFPVIQQVLETLNIKWMMNKETRVPSQTEIEKEVETLLTRIVNEGLNINDTQYLLLNKLGFEAAYYGKGYADKGKAGRMTLSFSLQECYVTEEEVIEEHIEPVKSYSVPIGLSLPVEAKEQIDHLSDSVVQLKEQMNEMKMLLERQMNLSMQIRKDQTTKYSDEYVT